MAGISSQAREQVNSVSRGQSLKMFLSVFRDTMMLHFRDDDSTSAAEMRFRSATAFSIMLKVRFEQDNWLDDEGLDDELDRALATVLANHRAGRHPLAGIVELDPLHLTAEAEMRYFFGEPSASTFGR